MKYGIFATMQQRDLTRSSQRVVNDAIEQAMLADQLGYESAWFPEHHFNNYSLCPSPLMLIAACAKVTKQIRLGAAVLIAPLYNPARLVSEIGLVDGLTDGRLEIGLGSGYQKFEFDRFGIDLANNKQATLEMWDILERALTTGQVEYHGQQFTMPPTSFSARCVQQPMPPVWAATADPLLMKRALQGGHNIFLTGWLASWKRLGRLRDMVDQVAVEAGRPTNRIGLLRFAFASHDRREVEHYVDCARYQQRLGNALKNRRESASGGYVINEAPYDEELPWEKMLENVPVGDPETCAERICRDIRAMRPDHLALHTQIGDMDQKVMLRAIETWMTRVVPLVEKELAKDALPLGAVAA